MKALKLITMEALLFITGETMAQVKVNVHPGSPPMWGPVGYSDVRYYYLPEAEAYYDIRTSNFIYLSEGKWVHRKYLGGRNRNYDLYNGYKVVLNDYHGSEPYSHFKDHIKKYPRQYRGEHQKTIGSKPGNGNSRSKDSHKKSHHKDH